MKHKLKLLLLVMTLMYGCTSEDLQQEVITDESPNNKIEFKVNGLLPENTIHGLGASLCCDNRISVSFDHWFNYNQPGGHGGTGLSISLDKNGNFLGLSYRTYSPNNEYFSPLFSSTSTIIITEFEFVENQILRFKINGRIFKKTYNFFEEPDFIDIEADIEIKEFRQCICSDFPSRLITDTDFIFSEVSRSHIGQNQNIRYSAFTNNGYHLEFINFNEFIQNMPLGTYEFDENTTSHRIDFRKFIGVPRFFSGSILSQEWLKFETSGNFEILEKEQIGNHQVSKVKFNLIARQNNFIVFEFTNAVFQTTM